MVLWLSLDCLSDALYLLDIAVHLHTGQCPSPPTRPAARSPTCTNTTCVCTGTCTHNYTQSRMCAHMCMPMCACTDTRT